MELRRMSDQAGWTLREQYEHLAQRHPYFDRVGPRMLDLIPAIEQRVIGPPHYATTSHEAIYLAEEDVWYPNMARVVLCAGPTDYLVKWRVTKPYLGMEESFERAIVESLDDAVHWVQHAIDHAERDLSPGRWAADLQLRREARTRQE